jgi:hypothetical protein
LNQIADVGFDFLLDAMSVVRIHGTFSGRHPELCSKVSPEGRAIPYTLNNWTALNRYCEDGDLEIDNNRTERGVAVGATTGFSLAAIRAAPRRRCCGVSWPPISAWESIRTPWIQDVLTRIAAHPITRLAELLPHNWKLAQS